MVLAELNYHGSMHPYANPCALNLDQGYRLRLDNEGGNVVPHCSHTLTKESWTLKRGTGPGLTTTRGSGSMYSYANP